MKGVKGAKGGKRGSGAQRRGEGSRNYPLVRTNVREGKEGISTGQPEGGR